MEETIIYTKSGNIIPIWTRGLVYLCEYHRYPLKLEVKGEIAFGSPREALEAYANIPNAESQIAYGRTWEEFKTSLNRLHSNIENIQWLEELGNQL